MPKKYICPKCQILFDAGNFCSNCGAKLVINPIWQAEEDKRLKEEQERKRKESSNEKTMLSIINTYRPYKNLIIKAINEFYNADYGEGEALSKLSNYIARYDKGEKDSLLRWYNDYCLSKYGDSLQSKANKILRYLTFLPDGKSEIVRELEDRVYEMKSGYSFYEYNSFFKQERLKNIKNSSQNYKARELAKHYSGALIENEMINAFLNSGTFSVDVEMIERSRPSTIDYIHYYGVTCVKYKYSKGVLDRIKYDIDYEFDDDKAGLETLRIVLDLEVFEKCVIFYKDIYENKNSYNPFPRGCFFTRESYDFHVLKDNRKPFKGAIIIGTSIHSGGEH